jgi:hypothetical protein
MTVIGDDPGDKVLRRVRDVQGIVEATIEDMRQARAALDNAVADLLAQRQREARQSRSAVRS